MNKGYIFFLFLIVFLFLTFNYFHFKKIATLQNRIIQKVQDVNLLKKKVDEKIIKIRLLEEKVETLKKDIEKANSFLRSFSYKYNQNDFRKKVNLYTQKFGILVTSFKFLNTSTNSLWDSFSLSLTGFYMDIVRFLYFLAKDYGNLDFKRIYLHREDIYKAKIHGKIKGVLYIYDRKKG